MLRRWRLIVAALFGVLALAVPVRAAADGTDLSALVVPAASVASTAERTSTRTLSAQDIYPESGDGAEYLRSLTVGGLDAEYVVGAQQLTSLLVEFRTNSTAIAFAGHNRTPAPEIGAGVMSSGDTQGGKHFYALAEPVGRIAVIVVVVAPTAGSANADRALALAAFDAQVSRVPTLPDLPHPGTLAAGHSFALHMGIGTGGAVVVLAIVGSMVGTMRDQGSREWAFLSRLPDRRRPVDAEVRDLTPLVRRSQRRRALLNEFTVVVFAAAIGFVVAWPGISITHGLELIAVALAAITVGTALWAQRRAGTQQAQGRASAVVLGLSVAASALVVTFGAAMIGAGVGLWVLAPGLSNLRKSVMLVLVGLTISAWSRRPVHFVRRLLQPVVRRQITRDDRRPVLLLRSFQDDSLEVRTPPTQLSRLDTLSGETYTRFEEVVAWRAWRVGPVLAIGQPGTVLQPLGAARDYFSDDEWQDAVEQRAEAARALIVVVGRSPGLQWEILNIRRHGRLGKTVFVLPPVSMQESANRIAVLAAALNLDPKTFDPGPSRHVVALHFTPVGTPVLETCLGRPAQAYALGIDAALADIPVDAPPLHDPAASVRVDAVDVTRHLVRFDPRGVTKPRKSLLVRVTDLALMFVPF